MDLLESTEYYIWWLKKHHMLISRRQIEEEVCRLITSFDVYAGGYCSTTDSFFEYLGTPEYLYLQDLKRCNYDVEWYEACLAECEQFPKEEWPRSYEADWGIDFIQDGFEETTFCNDIAHNSYEENLAAYLTEGGIEYFPDLR